MRKAKAEISFTYENPAINNYWIEVKNKQGVKKKLKDRKGRCSLCPASNGVSVVMRFTSFQRHMQIVHLPEEACEICGREIPAKSFNEHWEHCELDTTIEMEVGDIFRDSSLSLKQRFWVEVPSEYNRIREQEGRLHSKTGRCQLCPKQSKLISSGNINRHIKTFHLPSESCKECGLLVQPLHRRKHQAECLGMKRISVKIDTIAYVLYFYTPVNISSKNILDFCTNIF